MNINDRKQSWLDLYEGKKRALVIIEQSDYGVRPFPSPETMNAFFEWNIHRYNVMENSLQWLNDDRVPYVTAGMGTDIFAGAFGCPVYYPDDSNPFARPCVFNVRDLAKLKQPRLEDSSLMEVIDFGMKLRTAAPNALIQLPDVQSPLDIAALIWEKVDFFTTMIDEPEAIKDLLEMVYELETQFLDLWFDTFGKEFISHYPTYYMPYGITLSEDEIGSINNGMFKKFAWPVLADLSKHYGNFMGIHCCANARHQWELLKTVPGLMLLNLGQPEDVIREASVYFKDGPPIWAGSSQNKCHDFSSRAVLTSEGKSREEALNELNRLREYSASFKIQG